MSPFVDIVSARNATLSISGTEWGVRTGSIWHPLSTNIMPFLPILDEMDEMAVRRLAEPALPPFPIAHVLRALIAHKSEYWCASALKLVRVVTPDRRAEVRQLLTELSQSRWARQDLRHEALRLLRTT